VLDDAPLVQRVLRRVPGARALWHRWVQLAYYWSVARGRTREQIFTHHHEKNWWGDPESRSGSGATLRYTENIRREIPRLLEEFGVRSVLDAPCGDYAWMSEVGWDLDWYVGVDIVPELIERNRAAYESAHVEFRVADITRDRMPRADLVLVRDCFVHMSHGDVAKALCTLRDSGSTFLLTTTYPGAVKRNWNIVSGWWRALDFQRPPFNFPPPERVIHEHNTEQYDKREKSLGLWRFSELPLSEPRGT